MKMRENVIAMMILLLFCTNRQVVKLFAVWEKEREREREREREGEGEREKERERGGGEYTYAASQ